MIDNLFNFGAIAANLTGFHEIKRKRSKLNTSNPFFILMQELSQNNFDSQEELINFINIDSSNRKTTIRFLENRLYICFPVCTKEKIFLSLEDKTYQLTDSHLTIDKLYVDTNKTHGLYPAHYTEEYDLLSDEKQSILKKVKVHVYLDKNGHCVYTQASEGYICNETRKFINSRNIYNFEDYEILKNAQVACGLFVKIIKKRNQVLENLILDSKHLEKELQQLSSNYILNGKTQKDFEIFQERTKKFIQVVKQINQYSDGDLDMRGKIASTILCELKKKITSTVPFPVKGEFDNSEFESSSESDSDLTVTIETDQVLDSKHLELVDDEKVIKELISKLKQISQSLASIEPKKKKIKEHRSTQIEYKLKKLNLLQQAKQVILRLEFMPQHWSSSSLIAEYKSMIARMNDQCFSVTACKENEQLLESVFDFFTTCCISGDLINVEKLFSYVKYKIDDNFLRKVINQIIQSCVSFKIGNQEEIFKQENDAVKILKFLYNNVPRYQTILPYIIESNCLISDLFGMNCFDRYTFLCFTLSGCALNNKFLLFQTLLDQGASPNGACLLAINKDHKCYALSIIKFCLIMHDKIDPKFIVKLFEYGASITNQQYFSVIDLNTESCLGILKPDSKKPIYANKVRVNLNKQYFEAMPEYRYFAQIFPYIEKPCNIAYVDKVLDEILEHSRTIDLIVLFLYLAGENGSEKIILHDREIIKQKMIINFKEKLDLTDNQCQNLYYFTYVYNIKLPNGKNAGYIKKIINNIFDKISVITTKKSKELDYLIKVSFEQLAQINPEKQCSTIEQKNHLCKLRHAVLKSILLLTSFKDQINHKDLEIIKNIYALRENLLRILQQNNHSEHIEKSIEVMRRTVDTLVKNITIKDIADTNEYSKNITPMFAHSGNTSSSVSYCEPPPGSQQINGITVVPGVK